MGSAKNERCLSTRVLQGTPNAVGLSGLDYLLSTDILHSFGLPPLCPCQGLATKCSLRICLSSWPYRRDPHYSSLMSPEFTFAVGMSSRWASASRHPDCTTSRTRESIGSLWVYFLVSCSVTDKASTRDMWIMSTSSGLSSGPVLMSFNLFCFLNIFIPFKVFFSDNFSPQFSWVFFLHSFLNTHLDLMIKKHLAAHLFI